MIKYKKVYRAKVRGIRYAETNRYIHIGKRYYYQIKNDISNREK